MIGDEIDATTAIYCASQEARSPIHHYYKATVRVVDDPFTGWVFHVAGSVFSAGITQRDGSEFFVDVVSELCHPMQLRPVDGATGGDRWLPPMVIVAGLCPYTTSWPIGTWINNNAVSVNTLRSEPCVIMLPNAPPATTIRAGDAIPLDRFEPAPVIEFGGARL